MFTPFRSQSSTIGSEDNYFWCESMEKLQRENDRQMQSLISQTSRLKEENEELRAPLNAGNTETSAYPQDVLTSSIGP